MEEALKEQIFVIINTQILKNAPPEIKSTFDRLRKEGYDDFYSRQLIGQCLSVELFSVLKHKLPYDNERYVRKLIALPKTPSEYIAMQTSDYQKISQCYTSLARIVETFYS